MTDHSIIKPFECVVCYGDGTTPDKVSGKIISACKHEICANCYTHILMHTGKNSCCPICRAKYWKETQNYVETDILNNFVDHEEIGQLALFDILQRLQIRPPS